VTQECFLSILRRPEAFRAERASLRTYMCAIVRHLALKQFRKRGQETVMDDPPDEPQAAAWSTPVESPLETVMEDETARAVRRAVEALPPLQREAVVLFEYQEMSLADIAAACDIDVGTVKSRLHRARERLRRTLAPYLASVPAAGVDGRETRS
jgi:RNA polymerase sigma-70 factor (ECF subfamily)